MVKTILFNPIGQSLHAEVTVGGIVIVSYSLRLFSADVTQEKVIQQEVGNNRQPHDDTFRLFDKDNPSEPISNNNKRFLGLLADINTDKTDTPFTIKVTIYQGTPGNSNDILDSVEHSGSISSTDGGLTRNLGIIFKNRS